MLMACDVYEPKELKFSGHFFKTRLVSYQQGGIGFAPQWDHSFDILEVLIAKFGA